MGSEKTLADLRPGEKGIVKDLKTKGLIRRRLQDIGLIENTEVVCLFKSLNGNPIAYLIRGAVIAIRTEDSSKITLK